MKPDVNDIFDGLESLNIMDIQRHLIKKLYDNDYDVRDMAKVIGISERTIFRELAKMGVQTVTGKVRKAHLT